MSKSKREAIESWITEMDFNGDNMIVTKEETRNFLSDVIDVTEKWGEANRSIGIIQGAFAVTAGLTIGGLTVAGLKKLENKIEEHKKDKS